MIMTALLVKEAELSHGSHQICNTVHVGCGGTVVKIPRGREGGLKI